MHITYTPEYMAVSFSSADWETGAAYMVMDTLKFDFPKQVRYFAWTEKQWRVAMIPEYREKLESLVRYYNQDHPEKEYCVDYDELKRADGNKFDLYSWLCLGTTDRKGRTLTPVLFSV